MGDLPASDKAGFHIPICRAPHSWLTLSHLWFFGHKKSSVKIAAKAISNHFTSKGEPVMWWEEGEGVYPSHLVFQCGSPWELVNQILGQQLWSGASGSVFQGSTQEMPMLLLHLLIFGKQVSIPRSQPFEKSHLLGIVERQGCSWSV